MDFPRPTKYVKFKGPFKELKKNGWTFQKLFARNYRSYSKTCDGKQYGHSKLWIWQHLGGYLEVDDFHELSYLVIDFIQTGKYKDGYKKLFTSYCYYGQIDKLTLEITPGVTVKEPFLYETNPTEEQTEKWGKEYDEWISRYRRVGIDDDDIREISDLLNRGWIEIQVDKRPIG